MASDRDHDDDTQVVSDGVATWGPIPLAVRTALGDLVHLALLKLASTPTADSGGAEGGAAAALESLARHRGLPQLPKGEKMPQLPKGRNKRPGRGGQDFSLGGFVSWKSN